MTLISFASLWKLLIPWQESKLNYIVITQRSKTEMKIAFKNSGCLVAENNVLFCIHKYDNKTAMTTDNNNNNGYSS